MQEASAQVTIFMRISGIPGSSTDDRHKDWIEARSLTQTLTPDMDKKVACGIEVVKGLDIAGPLLWVAAVTGAIQQETLIEVVNEGGDWRLIYSILLQDVRVRGITTAGSDTFAERLSLMAGRVKLTYYPLLPNGTPGAPVTGEWRCY